MSIRKPSIKDVQKRVANISIGASTLRNQGVSLKKTVKFLRELKLAKLREMTKDQFSKWLDKKTESLMEEFKLTYGDKDNWGAARKAINIFLENAFYDRFLAKEYGLEKLEDILEIPLDSNVVKKLCGDSEQFKKFKNFTIIGLKPKDSEELQTLAKKRAESKRTSRIYLDLKYWRA
jgi:hypothetical protein